MTVKAKWVRNVSGIAKEISLTILVPWIFYGFVLLIMEFTSEWPAAVGPIAVSVYLLLALVMVIWDLRSLKARGYSVWTGLRIFFMLILIGAALFGVISSLLETAGWAKYKPEGVSFYEFNGYYLLTFINLLPGLEVSETLGIKLPVEPDGLVAGVLVLFYRVCVIYGVIRFFAKWWSTRGTKEEHRERLEPHDMTEDNSR